MRRRRARHTILFVAAAVAACHGPTSAPDPLSWTIGTWHGTRRAADDDSVAPMQVRVELLPDGRGQVECVHVDGDRAPYVGVTLRWREGTSQRWNMVYVNSAQHAFGRYEGRVDGARSTWDSVTAGRTRESQLVSEQLGADRWRKQQLVSEDGGRTWRVLFTDELERGGGK